MPRGFVVALLLTVSAAASAADLVEIVRQARDADATYAAARATWAAAQERLPQARAGLLPLISASGSLQLNDRRTSFRNNTNPGVNTDSTSNELALTVTQPLYRAQSNVVYDQALTQIEQADIQLSLAAQELILRAAQAYFDVLLAQDNVAFAEAQKTAIGQQLAQARRNFEVGTATITDTHEAQARFDLTTAQEIAARNELDLRRRALEQVIARSAPPLAPLTPVFPLKSPEPANINAWIELAQQGNLQMRIARSGVTFASQEIDRNRAAHLPTLDAFATVSTSGSGSVVTTRSDTSNRNATVGLQVAIPIYQGGLVNSRVREAIANQERARQDFENARRTAVFTSSQAFLGITNGTAQVRALEAALVSTESQLSSTRLGQDVGVRTQVDVLNAQQLLFSARRDLAQSKYNYILSLLRLEAAIGELTEADVAEVNRWLQSSVLSRSPDAEEMTPTGEGLARRPPLVRQPESPPTVQTPPQAAPAARPVMSPEEVRSAAPPPVAPEEVLPATASPGGSPEEVRPAAAAPVTSPEEVQPAAAPPVASPEEVRPAAAPSADAQPSPEPVSVPSQPQPERIAGALAAPRAAPTSAVLPASAQAERETTESVPAAPNEGTH